ncbi:hypothetical protein DXT99_08580 [Pontibacter diazotrophicus]|uniref:Outer membrane protein beta-barrel domain-containing protein n=1 Tax=Pontibacter diazotrophicus TaxID=1400979 RepID=A0A3D8LDQ5_9BACT|nr:hypothetical protein [Pontibacter diazotrophicus]RDV15535.1 hypothetical protein DXT99_08580 [Pontibacter diazotrophicus]
MPRILIFLLCLFLLCQLPLGVQAQEQAAHKNAFTVKLFGLSVHLKESPYPEMFPNRLDNKGYITFNYGAIVGYDRFVVRDVISVRVEQGLYADCAAVLAGFTHIGWRGLIFRKNRHSLNGGVGPTLVYRRDWNNIEDYVDDGYFERKGDWQYKFYWYAGELEYNYKLKKNTDLSVNLVPGIPELVSFGVGIRKRF